MGTKPQTFQGDLAHLPEALSGLTQEERWLAWRWELRTTKGGKEKWTKPPYQPSDPDKLAKPNKRETWGSYPSALHAVQAHQSDGIGYALLGSDVGAVDIDRVRDPSTNDVVRWARQLCEEATGAYVEVTVSGTGLRILGRVSGPGLHRRFNFDRKTGAGIELYRNTPRYVTVSGLQVGECAKLPVIDEILDRWFARYATGGDSGESAAGNGGDGGVLDFNDVRGPYDDVIRNGCPKGERSEEFHSVVFHLARQGWTVDQITDELAKHPNGIGAKYAKRLRKEVERSYTKWRKENGTAATGGPTPATSSSGIIPPPGIVAPAPPQIIVVPGQLPRVVNEAEAALLRSGNELYQRGSLDRAAGACVHHRGRGRRWMAFDSGRSAVPGRCHDRCRSIRSP